MIIKSKIKKRLSNILKFLLTLIVLLSILLVATLGEGNINSASAQNPIHLPLSTRGSKIVDKKGKQFILRGVNWFGMETSNHVPHGLWKRDYKAMLAQIKGLGYNFIRLPYSLAALRSTEVSGIDFRIGHNKDLQGKTPLEIMDAIAQEAQNQGLLILLDCHRLNDERIGELWYGDGFTEKDWINTWVTLAQRYKNQTNIIGADLKNEPHGKASWGTNIKATDFRLAAERAGNAIGRVNPNWLIIVQGVENNVPNQKLKHHWQGGNLEGVRRYPVRLSIPQKLVYSPHEYGPGVFNQPYFSHPKFPKNLKRRWKIGFYYIAKQKRAPILVGEFGGREIDKNTIEGKWQQKFVKFLRKKKLSFAYWSWNPNSADTGGILLDDWQTIDVPKQQLISRLLPQKFNPKSINQENNNQIFQSQKYSNTSTTKISLASSSTSTQLQLTTNIDSDWDSGFCISFKIRNASKTEVKDWQVSFKMKQADINDSWNANFQSRGSRYIVTPLDWGKRITPSNVRDIGFCAKKQGSDYLPQEIKVN